MATLPTIDELLAKISVLERANAAQAETIGVQAAELEELRAKVAELQRLIGRHSANSSVPPSRDTSAQRKAQAEARRERRGAERKPGKQPGAEGKNLAQVTDPDEVIELRPDRCCDCGGDLASGEDLDEDEVRQVFDIPKPEMIVTEYRARKVRCRCGTTNVATFPAEARAPASYGPRVRAIGLYLMARQHIPFERAAEALRDLFGVEVSTGFLDFCYSEGAERLDGFVEALRLMLKDEPVVHFDETSDRLGTATMWFHVACTDMLTLLHADETRGHDAVVRHGVLPGYTGIAVHDRLSQYQSYTSAAHAFCCAHLVRDLTSVSTIPGQAGWSTKMIDLLYEMHAATEAARDAGRTKLSKKVLDGYLARYDDLVAWAFRVNPEQLRPKPTKLQRESFNLATAFRTHRTEITRFASDLRVAFSNNEAERDLRHAKIHRKVSGCFHSMQGAKRLANVRSYLTTARKHDLGAFEVLTRLFQGDPWIPQVT